ncbi:MAG: DUF6273 domain-containing protein [Candidatus Promineifilaceae bacterium]|jgi:hypothetical protein
MPGQIITFGRYPQTAGGSDTTPIRWRVLQNSADELFLLSAYILDCRRYHGRYVDITWRDCDLRRWLNDEFYNAVFDGGEKDLIKTTRCTDNGAGSPDTVDQVFLLSVAEIKELTDPNDGTAAAIRRRTIGTEFAKVPKSDGCRLYVYDKGVERDYIIENSQKRGCSWWWTRTQLQIQDGRSSRAAFIGARSNIKSYGRVDLPYYGVRPALKLLHSSGIFDSASAVPFSRNLGCKRT